MRICTCCLMHTYGQLTGKISTGLICGPLEKKPSRRSRRSSISRRSDLRYTRETRKRRSSATHTSIIMGVSNQGISLKRKDKSDTRLHSRDQNCERDTIKPKQTTLKEKLPSFFFTRIEIPPDWGLFRNVVPFSPPGNHAHTTTVFPFAGKSVCPFLVSLGVVLSRNVRE